MVVQGKAYDLESTDGEVRIVHAFLPTHVAIIDILVMLYVGYVKFS